MTNNTRHRIALSIAIVALLLSATATLAFFIFGFLLGPTTVRNQFISFWLNALVLYHSCQSIYLIQKRTRFIVNNFFYLDVAYFAVSSLAVLLLVVFFSFALQKADAIAYSVLLFVVCLFNSLILVFRRKNYMNRLRDAEAEKANYQLKPTKEPPDFFEDLRDEEKETCVWKCRRVFNVIFKLIFLLILGFLVAGAWTIGIGYIWYPPRGQFSVVKLNDTSGREMKIHWMCDGPRDNTEPVFIFDGSGSHVMADYFGLQLLLTQQNRRSCIFDLPGQGYSDDLFSDMNDIHVMYHNMIVSFGERPPFIVVGWGAGGETFYKYAYDHPEMIHSIVLMDTYPVDIEFRTPYVLKNWTDHQREHHKRSVLASRRSLLDIIDVLAVPFGLMPIFVPRNPDRFPTDRADEMRWYFLTDRTWIAQRHWIKGIEKYDDTFAKYQIDQSIPINMLSTSLSDEQVIKLTCVERLNIDPESDECKYEVDANRYMTSEKEKLSELTSAGGQVVRCTFDECSLAYWIDSPQYTVDKLLELYGK